jgi:hypothetical protein
VDAANYLRREVAGFTIGGPIKRDKAFFFGVLDTTHTTTKAASHGAAGDPARRYASSRSPICLTRRQRGI